MQTDFAQLLLGKDLRSIGRANEVVRLVGDQVTFDQLFGLLLHHERLLVMRAADAVEKITIGNPFFLNPHKHQLLSLLRSSVHKELKWHLALLIARVDLSAEELKEVWGILRYWALNPNESKIVRVNSIQGLFALSEKHHELMDAFLDTLHKLEDERIPSLQAGIRKLRKLVDKIRTSKSKQRHT